VVYACEAEEDAQKDPEDRLHKPIELLSGAGLIWLKMIVFRGHNVSY
jgi:hypothetical protein